MGLFDFLKGKPKPAASAKIAGEEIGRITHYFPHVKAGVVKLKKGKLAVGDTIRIVGHTTDFTQQIKSLQVDRKEIQEGKKGQELGIAVQDRVRIHDTVYKISS